MPSRRSPAGKRTPLTVERITQAALEVVEESGYVNLSMRAVADRLDTGQASLYAHVRNKAELDRLLMSKVFDDYEAPKGASWRERLTAGAANALATYARYPGLAVGGFASLPTSNRFLDDLEADLGAMCAAGLTLREALDVHTAVGLIVAARSMEDAVIAERITQSGLTADEWWEQARQSMALNPERHPLLAQASAGLGPAARDRTAAEIVEIALDGAQARYGAGGEFTP